MTNKTPLRLVNKQSSLTHTEESAKNTPINASELAKLAADVIAWNRQSQPEDQASEGGPRVPRVVSLSALKGSGMRIVRDTEESAPPVTSIFKE